MGSRKHCSIWRGPGKVFVHIRCEHYTHACLVLDLGTFVRSICRRQGYFHHQYTTTSTYSVQGGCHGVWEGGNRDAPLRSAANTIGQKYASSLNYSVADVSRDPFEPKFFKEVVILIHCRLAVSDQSRPLNQMPRSPRHPLLVPAV